MFGKLHPLIVHLPIGILLFNIVLVVLTRWDKYAAARPILKWSLGLGALSAIAACVTGWILSQNGEYNAESLSKHQYWGIGVAVFASLLLLLKQQEKLWGSIVLGVLLSVAGHFGGDLTHGENYLWEMPTHTEGVKSEKPIIKDIQKALIFKDLIQPILNEKCVNCHSSTKQKGQLRLDAMTEILKGGKNGAALVIGQADQSSLIKRILLDIHSEEHMPPKGKPQITESELTLLKWWINEGASNDKTVESSNPPDAVKAILSHYNDNFDKSDKASANTNDFLPKGNVSPIDEKLLIDLKKKAIVALPIAPNTPFISVNFISKTQITDSDVQELKPVLQNIAWLKLGNSTISDAAMPIIAQMPYLTKLYLNNTPIGDNALIQLSNLENLQYLNLTHTAITIKGLTPLSKMKHLKEIYLFNSGVTLKDSTQLRTLFPHSYIDLGGYQVPTLASDTSILKAKK